MFYDSAFLIVCGHIHHEYPYGCVFLFCFVIKMYLENVFPGVLTNVMMINMFFFFMFVGRY